ncbi:hypothetical protein MPH_09424 [Macrophomina phaseolina MS6]|uniref:Uncharacterized protein n=1 Tax=Macrophomina phaseolina (strain MS6) TaxID=1126212 RepID=K2RFL8_MACPH|nr:hypothetical protein MPH_09424 [Macrophomina phaseolina MS6]
MTRVIFLAQNWALQTNRTTAEDADFVKLKTLWGRKSTMQIYLVSNRPLLPFAWRRIGTWPKSTHKCGQRGRSNYTRMTSSRAGAAAVRATVMIAILQTHRDDKSKCDR